MSSSIFISYRRSDTAPWAGRLVAQLHTLRRMSVSVNGMLQAGKEPVVEGSVVKDLGTIWEQKLPHKVREIAAFVEPEDSANRVAFEEQVAFMTTIAPKLTIQGGTTEVLRGIIAAGLGRRGVRDGVALPVAVLPEVDAHAGRSL
jgi:acyl-CoA dehydrogenase